MELLNPNLEMNNKPILIVGHIGISTAEHVAHVLALHGLHACDVEIITPDDAKEMGILMEMMPIPKIDDILKEKVYELKAHPPIEMPMIPIVDKPHKQKFLPSNHKRTNKKNKRR